MKPKRLIQMRLEGKLALRKPFLTSERPKYDHCHLGVVTLHPLKSNPSVMINKYLCNCLQHRQILNNRNSHSVCINGIFTDIYTECVCFFMWANFLALCWLFRFISNNDLAIFLKVSQKVTSSLLHDGILIYKTTWQKSASPFHNSWIIKASFREIHVPEATLYKKAADYFPPCEEESETLSERTFLKPVFLPFIVTESSGYNCHLLLFFTIIYFLS